MKDSRMLMMNIGSLRKFGMTKAVIYAYIRESISSGSDGESLAVDGRQLQPCSAETVAAELGVSTQTVYRTMHYLRSEGYISVVKKGLPCVTYYGLTDKPFA